MVNVTLEDERWSGMTEDDESSGGGQSGGGQWSVDEQWHRLGDFLGSTEAQKMAERVIVKCQATHLIKAEDLVGDVGMKVFSTLKKGKQLGTTSASGPVSSDQELKYYISRVMKNLIYEKFRRSPKETQFKDLFNQNSDTERGDANFESQLDAGIQNAINHGQYASIADMLPPVEDLVVENKRRQKYQDCRRQIDSDYNEGRLSWLRTHAEVIYRAACYVLDALAAPSERSPIGANDNLDLFASCIYEAMIVCGRAERRPGETFSAAERQDKRLLEGKLKKLLVGMLEGIEL